MLFLYFNIIAIKIQIKKYVFYSKIRQGEEETQAVPDLHWTVSSDLKVAEIASDLIAVISKQCRREDQVC